MIVEFLSAYLYASFVSTVVDWCEICFFFSTFNINFYTYLRKRDKIDKTENNNIAA